MRRLAHGVIPLLACTAICFIGCSSKVNHYSVSSFSQSGAVNAVIEIPAGTNVKYEFDNTVKEFSINQENGKDRSIDFLPYPANYGFIPSTLSDGTKGGDGDALDILVISETIKKGTILEVIPIGMLKLIDEGELDYKVIAVPFDENKRTIKAINYDELSKNYPAIIEIIELWFLNYNKKDKSIVRGWGNEKETIEEIKQAVTK